MRLGQYRYLADQNIDRAVVRVLAGAGLDIVHIAELGMSGQRDSVILGFENSQRRAVLSHDSDFGMLAVHHGVPFVGFVYLRPGHIAAEYTRASMNTVLALEMEVAERFIVVADRRGIDVNIRVRTIP